MKKIGIFLLVASMVGLSVYFTLLYTVDSGLNSVDEKVGISLTRSEINTPEREQTFGRIDRRISDIEFERISVDLPPPLNGYWAGGFFDSESIQSEEHISAAVDLIPNWIRKAIVSGDLDLAGKYLNSLILLVDNENFDVSYRATINLYRLGDYASIAYEKMQGWILENVSKSVYYNDLIEPGVYDVRAVVLQEFMYHSDDYAVSFVEDKWKINWSDGLDEPSIVDYGFFLELNGVELPEEYWQDRLQKSKAIDNALNVIESRNLTNLESPLVDIFEKNQIVDQRGNNLKLAAKVAGTLYKVTEDEKYFRYILDSTKSLLDSGAYEKELPELMKYLSELDSPETRLIISRSIFHSNQMIRENSIEAIRSSNAKFITDLLVDSALRKLSAGRGFPSSELRAISLQGSSYSLESYYSLKNRLLSGDLEWTPLQVDFDRTDYFATESIGEHAFLAQ